MELAVDLRVGVGELVNIHAAGIRCCVPCLLVIPGRFVLVDECCHFLSEKIVDPE